LTSYERERFSLQNNEFTRTPSRKEAFKEYVSLIRHQSVFFFFGGENNNNSSSCTNEDFAPARMPRRAKSFSEEEEEEERPVGIFVGFEQRRTTGKILIDEE
jgi:hypothetical protein